MAISSTKQTEILKIVAGLFNAAPGGSNLSELAKQVEGGMTTSQLADALASIPLFTSGILAGKVTVDDQVNVLMNNFGMTADSDAASAGSQAKAYFTQQITDGVGFGKIVFDAVTFLSATTDAKFAAAQTLLNNKALVAAAYSSANSSSDLSVLQKVLSNVKGDAPYTPADVTNVLAGSGSDGSGGKTFSLTSGADQADTTGSFKNGGLVASDFKFTPANETVTASAGTLAGGDVLADSTATDADVLNATLTSGTAVTPSISGIEAINLDVKTSNSGLDLASVAGAKAINVNTNIAIAAQLTNVNTATVPTIGLSGSGVLTVAATTLAGTTAGGNAESLSVKLNGANTSGTGVALQRAGLTLDTAVAGALETLNLESAGSAKNTLVLSAADTTSDADVVAPTGISKTVVTGGTDLDLLVANVLITGQTLDASTHTGSLNLFIDRNGAATAASNLTNVKGVDTYTFRDSAAGGDAMVASGLVDGTNVVLTYSTTGASSLAIKGAASSTSNVLNLTLDNAVDATDVAVATSLTINDVETVNIKSEGGTTAGNSIAGLTVDTDSKVTVDGATKLDLQLAATSAVASVQVQGSGNHKVDFAAAVTYADGKNLTIDGNTATGKLTLDGGDFTGTAGTKKETLTINGGSNDDTITGTTDANSYNVIDASGGKDTVNVLGAAAKSTVSLGDGVDTLNLAAATANLFVTDFALGASGDKLSVDTVAAMTFGGVGAASANNQLVIANASVANDAAAAALVSGTATAEAAVIVINDATGFAELWYDADGTAGGEVKLATFENITTVGVLTDTTSGFVADNFGTWG
ncbi:MAG: hypothetical protein JSS37_11225 [Proteobacteria bacterium]|nr:hypothetical protein [Pseudomonadota bacterium]